MKKFLLLFTLAIFPYFVRSQVNFSASPAIINAGINQTFRVTYILKGGATERYSVPGFGNINVIGTMTSSGGSRQIVNGKVIAGSGYTESWEYTCRSSKKGTFTISPAKVMVNGVWYSSNAVSVVIGDAPANSSNTGTSRNNSSNTSSQVASSPQSETIDAFVRATADRSIVYEGQPVIVSFKIYTTAEQAQYNMNKTASYDGFWSEELIDPQAQRKPGVENINGRQYMVGEIRRIALYPQKSGKLRIEAQEVEAILKTTAKVDASGIFDDFFKDPYNWNPFNSSFFKNPFGNVTVDYDTRSLKSNPIDITVLPLPAAGMPDNFTNAVGRYSLEAWLDNDKCFVGDAITLKVKISGKGNLKLIDAPIFELPKTFDCYEPEIEDNLNKTLNGIEGDRIFSYVIIPNSGGDFTIDPIKFCYFDPDKKQYFTLQTPPIAIKVAGDGNANTNKGSQINENDIRYIHTDTPSFRPINQYLFSRWWFIALLTCPILLLISLMIVLRRRIKIRQDIKAYRMRMALRVANKRLKVARKLMSQNQEIAFYQELSRALWLFATDKLSIPVSELSVESVKSSLVPIYGENMAVRFSDLLNECDFARFAPGDKALNMARLYERAKQVIMDFQNNQIS